MDALQSPAFWLNLSVRLCASLTKRRSVNVEYFLVLVAVFLSSVLGFVYGGSYPVSRCVL